MRNYIFYILICLELLSSDLLSAQGIPVNDQAISSKYPFASSIFNRIFNNGGLDSFYQKLYDLKNKQAGVVTIVHIGDSHLQAGFISGVMRDQLQDYFGNAGRGLVFPYQLAQSNAPDDITSSSNTVWQFNRLAHPEIALPYGIAGFGIMNAGNNARISLSLRAGDRGPQTFDRLRFFVDTISSASWSVSTGDSAQVLPETDSLSFREWRLSPPASGFTLSLSSPDRPANFYGVSLEKSAPGILYHSIGVNGARYDHFNEASLFWQQLPALRADLYIISLGTNDAQRAAFVESVFLEEVDTLIHRLRRISPKASILVTTAPDSYKGRSSNKVLQQLNKSLADYCNRNYIPFWDLYRITNGYGSAYSWARRGLMSRDRIHFTAEGYRLQGSLFFSALAKGYNNYSSIH